MLDKLKRLKFKHKIILLPVLAGIAFLLILIAVNLASVKNRSLMKEIEEGYFPGFRLSRDLKVTLSKIQRNLQDAVAASDTEMLDKTKNLKKEFLSTLRAQKKNEILNLETLKNIERKFTDYYSHAYSTSSALIKKESSTQLMKDLKEMRNQYNSLKDRLDKFNTSQKKQISRAFQTTRDNYFTAIITISAILLACIGILGFLSWFIIKSLTDSVDEAVTAADHLAEGDLDIHIPRPETDDAIGQLLTSMREMLEYLNEMATVAEGIADGNVDVDVTPRSSVDRFGTAFSRMVDYLEEMASTADSIATGDLEVHIEKRSRSDRFGNAFAEMIDYLKEMAKIAESIADGDLRVDIEKRSERDRFSSAFSRMIGELRDIMEKIKLSSEQLASSSNEISTTAQNMKEGAESQSSSTQETSSTITEMAAQIDNIADSADNLAQNVDNTSSSIQEMSSSINQMADNADNLMNSVEKTTETIEDITSSIQNATEKIDTTSEVSQKATKIASEGRDELTEVIKGIAQKGDDIEEIVSIIEDISDQTNLLALNASIQAAQAGKEGSSFAVVADEIKDLAERSMNAIKDISSTVETIQFDTSQAVELTESVLQHMVDSIEKTQNLVSEASSISDKQNEKAGDILKTSKNMKSITRELVSAVKEQAEVSEEIMKAVEEMNNMTDKVAVSTSEQKEAGNQVRNSIEHISEVAEQNLRATKELSEATVRLADESDKLQDLTREFEV